MNRLHINTNEKKSVINRNIYGHFSEHLGRCIYNGIFVDNDDNIPNTNGMRNDVVEALRNINIPVLRWPGGCFADEYHWKDGIGPTSNRKKMINTHWGGMVEDNSFGTHEFMELCRQLDCEPYINGNLGSGTVQEMSEWVEYLTFDGISPMAELRANNGRNDSWKVKYWGVGNENWGCGGNMRPEFYADQYRRYATYIRNYGDNKIFKIACGANDFNYEWTETLMKIAGNYMDALTVHYYTVPSGEWSKKGSATDFSVDEYYETLRRALRMNELINNHLQIMNRYDPDHKVGLIVDEWGTWYDVEPGTNPGFLYQQNTMRDALVAAVSFNIFNSYSDRVVMANIAQTVNVLQAVILTEGDKMVLTPTYHAFDLYKNHHDATLLGFWLEEGEINDSISIPNLSASVSEKNGAITATIANLHASESNKIELSLHGTKANKVSGRILSGAINAKNDFDAKDAVSIRPFDGIAITENGLTLEMPACSVAEIVING